MKPDLPIRPVRNESGLEIQPLYTADDVAASGGLSMLGLPGEYPFTRGIHPLMYRKQPFTMRQYTGLRQTPEQVVAAAVREKADVIALSSMAGSHLPFCGRLKPLLEEAGLGDKLWIIGGNLPAQDHDALRALGFAGVFPTGSKLDAIGEFIKERVA